jgi:hypothetical protein
MDKFRSWIIVIINGSLSCLSLIIMLLATTGDSKSQSAHAFIFIGLCGSMTFGIITFLVVIILSINYI